MCEEIKSNEIILTKTITRSKPLRKKEGPNELRLEKQIIRAIQEKRKQGFKEIKKSIKDSIKDLDFEPELKHLMVEEEQQLNDDQPDLEIGDSADSEETIQIDCSIDSEFVSIADKPRLNEFLSLQVCVKGMYQKKSSLGEIISQIDLSSNIIFVDNKYEIYFTPEDLEKLLLEKKCSVCFMPLDNTIKKSTESIVIRHISDILFNKGIFTKKRIHINLIFFFSAKDITAAFGKQLMGPIYAGVEGNLRNQNRITGDFYLEHITHLTEYKYRVILKDLVRIDTGSLANICDSCGIDTTVKKSLDVYKKNMVLAIKNLPYEFLSYGIFDAEVLHRIWDIKLNSANQILKSLDVTHRFTKKTLPLSVGSVSSALFNFYQQEKVFDQEGFYRMAEATQACFEINHPDHSDVIKAVERLKKEFNTIEKLREFKLNNLSEYNKMYDLLTDRKLLTHRVNEYAGISYLGVAHPNTNIPFLALVNGGRASNERPDEYQSSCCADVDIAGAYGDVLAKTDFPIGRPTLYTSTSNQEKISLGAFLEKYEKELSGTLYNIVVSGPLKHSQDLIYSRVIHKDKIYNAVAPFFQDEVGNGKINAPFVLLRDEIRNGIIIPKSLEIIKKVSSNQELKDIYALKVETAIYYSPLDQVKSIEELIEAWLQDKGKSSFNNKTQTTEDTRSRAWFPTPLKEFIGVLVGKRRELKKELKNLIINSPEYNQAFAFQNGLKLVINSLWGDLTSVYFRNINNVVVANIVSGITRCNVWLMAKAFGIFQSITDGGFYCLNTVNFLKEGKKPSLSVMSDYYELIKHPSISQGALADQDWGKAFEEGISPKQKPFTNLDVWALEHLKNFWARYKIEINFDLEHKMQNCTPSMGYTRKSHNACIRHKDYREHFETSKLPERKFKNIHPHYNSVSFKIRGQKLNLDQKNPLDHNSPLFNLFLHILEKKDLFTYTDCYMDSRLLSISGWKLSLLKRVKEIKKTTLKIKTVGDFVEPLIEKKQTKTKALPSEKLSYDYNSCKYFRTLFPGDAFLQFHTKFSLNNDFFFISTAQQYLTRFNRRRNQKNRSFFERYLHLGIAYTYLRMKNDDLRTTLKKDPPLVKNPLPVEDPSSVGDPLSVENLE